MGGSGFLLVVLCILCADGIWWNKKGRPTTSSQSLKRPETPQPRPSPIEVPKDTNSHTKSWTTGSARISVNASPRVQVTSRPENLTLILESNRVRSDDVGAADLGGGGGKASKANVDATLPSNAPTMVASAMGDTEASPESRNTSSWDFLTATSKLALLPFVARSSLAESGLAVTVPLMVAMGIVASAIVLAFVCCCSCRAVASKQHPELFEHRAQVHLLWDDVDRFERPKSRPPRGVLSNLDINNYYFDNEAEAEAEAAPEQNCSGHSLADNSVPPHLSQQPRLVGGNKAGMQHGVGQQHHRKKNKVCGLFSSKCCLAMDTGAAKPIQTTGASKHGVEKRALIPNPHKVPEKSSCASGCCCFSGSFLSASLRGYNPQEAEMMLSPSESSVFKEICDKHGNYEGRISLKTWLTECKVHQAKLKHLVSGNNFERLFSRIDRGQHSEISYEEIIRAHTVMFWERRKEHYWNLEVDPVTSCGYLLTLTLSEVRKFYLKFQKHARKEGGRRVIKVRELLGIFEVEPPLCHLFNFQMESKVAAGDSILGRFKNVYIDLILRTTEKTGELLDQYISWQEILYMFWADRDHDLFLLNVDQRRSLFGVFLKNDFGQVGLEELRAQLQDHSRFFKDHCYAESRHFFSYVRDWPGEASSNSCGRTIDARRFIEFFRISRIESIQSRFHTALGLDKDFFTVSYFAKELEYMFDSMDKSLGHMLVYRELYTGMANQPQVWKSIGRLFPEVPNLKYFFRLLDAKQEDKITFESFLIAVCQRIFLSLSREYIRNKMKARKERKKKHKSKHRETDPSRGDEGRDRRLSLGSVASMTSATSSEDLINLVSEGKHSESGFSSGSNGSPLLPKEKREEKVSLGAQAQELHRFNQLKKLFAFYDANHSGMLEWGEFEVFIRDMYEPSATDITAARSWLTSGEITSRAMKPVLQKIVSYTIPKGEELSVSEQRCRQKNTARETRETIPRVLTLEKEVAVMLTAWKRLQTSCCSINASVDAEWESFDRDCHNYLLTRPEFVKFYIRQRRVIPYVEMKLVFDKINTAGTGITLTEFVSYHKQLGGTWDPIVKRVGSMGKTFKASLTEHKVVRESKLSPEKNYTRAGSHMASTATHSPPDGSSAAHARSAETRQLSLVAEQEEAHQTPGTPGSMSESTGAQTPSVATPPG